MNAVLGAMRPVFAILGWIGLVAWILSGLLMLGWYFEWLDTYFLWRYFAFIVGFLTAPFIPLAVIAEWLWHGWPTEVGWLFFASVCGNSNSPLRKIGQEID